MYKKIFIATSVIYLIAELAKVEIVLFLFKPLIMVVLMLWVNNECKFVNLKALLIAQLFSLIGDTVLLFAPKGEIYFILGLIAFLIAQVSYSILFIKDIKMFDASCVLKVIPFTLLSTSLVILLKDKLGALLVPVCVYAAVITLMGSTSSLRNANKASYLTVLSGALFFVSSDSLLAINKFYTPIPLAGFLIMFTYIVAQYLIAEGILKNNKEIKTTILPA